MANALLVGLSKVYANTSQVATIHFRSHSITGNIQSGTSSSSYNGTAGSITPEESAKFIWAFNTQYPNITEAVEIQNSPYTRHFIPGIFVALTATTSSYELYNSYSTGSCAYSISYSLSLINVIWRSNGKSGGGSINVTVVEMFEWFLIREMPIHMNRHLSY